MRIGILDLLTDQRIEGRLDWLYAHYFRRQFVSLMPQVVAVWCRRLGHDVTYHTYYGQCDPSALLPDDLDVVFLASYTQASALAYALAKRFRQEGVRTILGGPHARAFPKDAMRFFDIVVRSCDERELGELLKADFPAGSLVDCPRPLAELPTVEERMAEIKIAAFAGGQPLITSVVPILSSVGCPYRCDFCIDWNSKYTALSTEQLRSDLMFIADHWPKVLIGYHDPNFAVRFDETMDIIESVPSKNRNPYIMESSLSILKSDRLHRLRETRCAYVAPGVESWSDYSNKAGVGSRTSWDKLAKVVEHFREVQRFVPGLQANFMFGGELDRGQEPATLTKAFIRALPGVFPTINIPTPYGGTPLFDRQLKAGRILKEVPFAFYYNPYLVTVPEHYRPTTYYRHLIDICQEAVGGMMFVRRLLEKAPIALKFIHAIRHLGIGQDLKAFRQIHRKLRSNKAFQNFHEGGGGALPEFYRQRLKKRLGPYAELLSEEDLRPTLA